MGPPLSRSLALLSPTLAPCRTRTSSSSGACCRRVPPLRALLPRAARERARLFQLRRVRAPHGDAAQWRSCARAARISARATPVMMTEVTARASESEDRKVSPVTCEYCVAWSISCLIVFLFLLRAVCSRPRSPPHCSGAVPRRLLLAKKEEGSAAADASTGKMPGVGGGGPRVIVSATEQCVCVCARGGVVVGRGVALLSDSARCTVGRALLRAAARARTLRVRVGGRSRACARLVFRGIAHRRTQGMRVCRAPIISRTRSLRSSRPRLPPSAGAHLSVWLRS